MKKSLCIVILFFSLSSLCSASQHIVLNKNNTNFAPIPFRIGELVINNATSFKAAALITVTKNSITITSTDTNSPCKQVEKVGFPQGSILCEFAAGTKLDLKVSDFLEGAMGTYPVELK